MPHKITNTGKPTFDDGLTESVATLQATAVTTQATADTAYRAHFARCIALALANGVNPAIYLQGLKDVGTRA